MALMALTSWLPGCVPAPGDTANLFQNSVLVGALMVVAIGTGGIKPNVSAFGADQFDETNPEVGPRATSYAVAADQSSLVLCSHGMCYTSYRAKLSWQLHHGNGKDARL